MCGFFCVFDPSGAAESLRLTQSAVVLENLISQFLFNKAAEGKDKDGK